MSRNASLQALADRFDAPLSFVEQVDELGVLPREEDGSVGAAAARRMQLLAFARSRGIADERLLDAMREYGDLFVSFDGSGLTPADSVEPMEVVAGVGMDPEVAQRIIAAGGWSADGPVHVEDIEAFRSAKRALDLGLSPEVLVQLIRVYADNMERLAEAENKIFHDHVHERFRAEGLTGRELMQATAGISQGLLEMVESTVVYFHRRAWAVAAQHDFIRHLTEDSRPVQTAPGAAPCTVMFADLSGFTPLTAAMGDSAAAEVLSRYAAAVRRITSVHDGRIIKQIGDGFMVVFERSSDAVLCGASLLDWAAQEARFPPIHIGAHAGEVLFHEGDYVGAAVNLAARVSAVTEPAQFLVTDAVVAELELPSALEVRAVGERTLKGLHDPVGLNEVTAAGGQQRQRLQDPVCGMSLDSADLTRTWQGRQLAFCSSGCEEVFDKDPTRFLGTQG